MNRITLLILFILFSTNAWAQEHCVFRPYHISTELFPGNEEALNFQDYFIIYSDEIDFSGVNYSISKKTVFPFENKDDLLRYFSCYHDFLSASENINGELIEIDLDAEIPRVGSSFKFIHYNDCGQLYQYVFVDDGLYRFSNNPFYEEIEVTILEEEEIEDVIVEYVSNVDTSALVYYLEEPAFELVTEQVLLKESYTILETIPAEYEVQFTVFYNEFSTCQDVIFDTIYQQLLVKEGSIGYEVTPAIFETVSEYRAIQNKFEGEFFYERAPLDSLVITLKEEIKEIENILINEGCSHYDFWECIDIEFNLIQRKDTVLFNVYEGCADEYKSAGKYCYHNEGTVPWIFELREYEKLAQPSIAIVSQIPNEYSTIPMVRITNKDDLGIDCVEIVYDSIMYERLVAPPLVQETDVPADYETLEYKYYQDGGKIEVVEGETDENMQLTTIQGGSLKFVEDDAKALTKDWVCTFESIEHRLLELGYIEESDIGNLAASQLALAKFQINHSLPLGVVDTKLIIALDIKFGY